MKIYHLTFEHAVDNIKKYGLLRGYLSPIEFYTDLIEYSKIIDIVADILEISIGLRRYNVNYAFVFGKFPSQFLTVHEVRNVCLEIDVDPEKVYISDMKTITRGFDKYLKNDETYILDIFDYFDKLVSLKMYVENNLLYDNPEVLIPYDVSPDKINIIDCEILIEREKIFRVKII